MADTAMLVAPKKRYIEADPLDQDQNSWSAITLKGAKWHYEDSENNFEDANAFSALADAEDYPNARDSLLTLHKNRHRFPKIKRVTQYDPEIEKLARFIEKKMKVKASMDITTVKPKDQTKSQHQADCPDKPTLDSPIEEETSSKVINAAMTNDEVSELTRTHIEKMLSKEDISGDIIKDVIVHNNEINLLTSSTPALGNVNAISQKMKWVKIPVAVDSGATANVTPKDIFSLEITPTPQSIAKENFCGADGGEIKNHGKQIAKGQSDSKDPMNITVEFDVADVSRPLGCVSKLVKKRHRVVFDDPTSFIQNKVTGKKIDLREQNGLYFLDLWVQVPADLNIPDRVVRQVE